MEQQYKMTREKVGEKQEEANTPTKQDGKDPPPPPPPPSSTTTTASPPSAPSSPSHEFSFTISLHSASTTIPDHKTKSPPPFAIDLSPADDIFFHGHLLPLHLLSHLPVSPRASTNSLDSFTIPIRELAEDQKPVRHSSNSINHCQSDYSELKGRPKSKTFSFFGLKRWRKGCEEDTEKEEQKHKRKPRFDVLKRYARMVRSLLLFRGSRGEKIQLRRQPYSFSGNLSSRGGTTKQEMRGRMMRGGISAPASMRTSPTNSGLLVATATIPSSTSDSTMEELQAAIQAAIAHCKKSIAVDEKLK